MSIHPVDPFGRSGSTTRPQRPWRARATTHTHVGEPSGVVPGMSATTRPAGLACTAAPSGTAASRNRGAGFPAADAAGAMASASTTAAAIAPMVTFRLRLRPGCTRLQSP